METSTSIYAVRTTIGQERSVTDLITTAVIGETDVWQCPFCSEDFSSEKATKEHMSSCKKKKKKKGDPILVSTNQLLGRVKAILVPETLRGYVFIETTEFRDVEIAISGVPHVRGRVGGKVSLEEIDAIGLVNMPLMYERWCLLQIIKVLKESFRFIPQSNWKYQLIDAVKTNKFNIEVSLSNVVSAEFCVL